MKAFDFNNCENNKCIVRFTIDSLGKTTTIENEYDYDVPWTEVIEDVVKALESFYGYSFKLKYDDGDPVGVYYDGRDDE